MANLPTNYQSPSVEQLGGDQVEPMAILIGFFYVLGAVIYDAAFLVNYGGVVNVLVSVNVGA